MEKLKEGNSTEAIEKFTKASELTSEVTKSAETLEKTTVENLEKFFEGESGKEVLKKYVYVDFN